jgi:hypothetical protein
MSTPTKPSTSPTSDAAQLQAKNPGLIPDMFYNSIAIDNYHFVFVHHDLAARVAVYFLFARLCTSFLLAATSSTPTRQTTSSH